MYKKGDTLYVKLNGNNNYDWDILFKERAKMIGRRCQVTFRNYFTTSKAHMWVHTSKEYGDVNIPISVGEIVSAGTPDAKKIGGIKLFQE